MKMKIGTLFISVLLGLSLAGCNALTPVEHVHTYNGYVVDGDYHYQVCTECGEATEKEFHSGGHGDCKHRAVCEVCGAEYGTLDDHQYEDTWHYVDGESTHYRECTVCHEVERANHVFNQEIQKDDCIVGEKTTDCEGSNTYYKSCVCGAHSHNPEETFIVANSHDFSLEEILENEANKIADATCYEAAVYGLVCSHCHKAFDPEHTFTYGEPLAHNFDGVHEEVKTFGTYHSDYYHCSECGNYFVKDGDNYVEKDYGEIFDESKTQYADESFGTENNPYIISCVEDLYFLRDKVNQDQTESFEGKYFKLGNDIDFNFKENEYFGTPIGYSDKKPFMGVFDGDGHTLKGLSIKGENNPDSPGIQGNTLSLFSRATNATIKNLTLENVSVIGNGQRNAGLVARCENSTIMNVTISSGYIEGTTECGGVVGAFVSGNSTIANCVNKAKIVSIGVDYPCLGGIAGASVNAMKAVIRVDGCTNYGEIDATKANTLGYSGGIMGLIRALSTEEGDYSVTISNCKNFGNISSNKTQIAGIVGIARAGTIVNCFCSNEAKISYIQSESKTVNPTKLVDSGKIGFIVGEKQENASVEGCCLCNKDGEVAHKVTGEPKNEPATCQHVGYENYQVCDLCGEIASGRELPQLDHHSDAAPLNVAPTCHSFGYENYQVCDDCGKVISGERLPMTEHHMEYVKTAETHQLKCTNEGCTEVGEIEEHHFNKIDAECVPATEQQAGKDVYRCEECGYEKEIPVIWNCPHTNLVHVDKVNSTCHKHGTAEHYYCSDCNKFFSDAEAKTEVTESSLVLDLADHNYVKHEKAMSFSTTTDEYYTCSYADHDEETDGAYFVKNEDEYVSKKWSDIFHNKGMKDEEKYYTAEDEYGTEENPYLISSLADLLAFRKEVNKKKDKVDENGNPVYENGKIVKVSDGKTFAGKYIKLTADINLADLGEDKEGNPIEFEPIGIDDNNVFSGTFDGDGHTIKNLVKSGGDSVGLFSRVTNGTIKNINLSNINITTETSRSAGFVSRADGATIINCHVLSGTITGAKENGGIVGVVVYNSTTIQNCSNKATIKASSEKNGGIVGFVHSGSANIVGCVNEGDIIDNAGTAPTKHCGGIVGCGNGIGLTVIDCINKGNIEASSTSIAGIVGYLAQVASANVNVISNCENIGNISTSFSGNAFVGGIVGETKESLTNLTIQISNCINRGNIFASNTGNFVGGISGLVRVSSSSSYITNCFNYGDVTGKASVGGISGVCRISTTNCGCLHSITLTYNGVATLASAAGETGGPGYIAAGYNNGASSAENHAGNRLINADGSDYVPEP